MTYFIEIGFVRPYVAPWFQIKGAPGGINEKSDCLKLPYE